MIRTENSAGRGRLRRLAYLVYEASGMADPPVISGLVDLENEHRWRSPR